MEEGGVSVYQFQFESGWRGVASSWVVEEVCGQERLGDFGVVDFFFCAEGEVEFYMFRGKAWGGRGCGRVAGWALEVVLGSLVFEVAVVCFDYAVEGVFPFLNGEGLCPEVFLAGGVSGVEAEW